MSVKRTINFVTGNKNKLKEVAAFLKDNDSIEIENVNLDRMNVIFVFMKVVCLFFMFI